MKYLTVIDSLRTGGAEKMVVDLLPLINGEESIQMDLLVLDGMKTPLLESLKNRKDIKIISLQTGSVHNPMLILKIMKFLRGYDLVHVHLFPASYWTVFAKLLSFSKAKLVFTEHSTYNKRRDKILFRYVDRFVYSKFSKIICISRLVYERLRKHIFIKDDKITIISNGINLDSINKTIAYDSLDIFGEDSPDIKYIIQVSSFRYPKDQKTVIKALSLLPPVYKLILIGEGPLKKECQDLCEELKLVNRVYFLGLRSDVFSFLKMADVVVLSSYYEGLSLSSIEGMASGKPFIASRAPGLEDIVSGAGVLFQPGDDKTLAEKIENLCNDAVFRNDVIKSCIERARKYDINKTTERYIQVYKSVL